MIRIDLLHGEIARAGLTKKHLADQMGITAKTYYAKEKRGVFTNQEIEVFIKECGIKDPMPIFFPDFVTQDSTST